jgi:hypothetical protein
MSFKGRLKQVGIELKAHSPFTLFGAMTGIVMMFLFSKISHQSSYRLFYVFHPAHVVLSAVVTASLFRLHEKTKGFLVVLIVGYVGSIGIATLSDSILPFFGEEILGVVVPTESAVHSHMHEAEDGEEHAIYEEHSKKEWHLGFIERWYIVNPAAFLGILIAYFLPRTKLPHAFHVLISTWASSAHIMMNTHQPLTATLMLGFFIVLFIAVWLPCCFSDIIFPILLVRADGEQCVFCGGEHHNKH